MGTVVISCKTIEKELNAAMQLTDCAFPVRWLEPGLHNTPKILAGVLQENLDACYDADTVLLAMGFCGNSVVGLHTHNFQLVLPRVDDCISLMLGSMEERKKHFATYFMTEGWLKGERNIWKEYEYCIQRYGEKLGKTLFDMMFQNYHNLALINTGCYEMAPAEEETRKIADSLHLQYQEICGTLSYLQSLLRGPWPADRFVIVPPNSVLTGRMCVSSM